MRWPDYLPSVLVISAITASSQFFWPAMPTTDFEVVTFTSVLSGASVASQSPMVSPPDPTKNPILCGRLHVGLPPRPTFHLLDRQIALQVPRYARQLAQDFPGSGIPAVPFLFL